VAAAEGRHINSAHLSTAVPRGTGIMGVLLHVLSSEVKLSSMNYFQGALKL